MLKNIVSKLVTHKNDTHKLVFAMKHGLECNKNDLNKLCQSVDRTVQLFAVQTDDLVLSLGKQLHIIRWELLCFVNDCDALVSIEERLRVLADAVQDFVLAEELGTPKKLALIFAPEVSAPEVRAPEAFEPEVLLSSPGVSENADELPEEQEESSGEEEESSDSDEYVPPKRKHALDELPSACGSEEFREFGEIDDSYEASVLKRLKPVHKKRPSKIPARYQPKGKEEALKDERKQEKTAVDMGPTRQRAQDKHMLSDYRKTYNKQHSWIRSRFPLLASMKKNFGHNNKQQEQSIALFDHACDLVWYSDDWIHNKKDKCGLCNLTRDLTHMVEWRGVTYGIGRFCNSILCAARDFFTALDDDNASVKKVLRAYDVLVDADNAKNNASKVF